MQTGDTARLVGEVAGHADADEEDRRKERQLAVLVVVAQRVVEVAGAQQLVDRGMTVGGRDDHLGELARAVGEAHAGGAIGRAGALGR